jgi:hypothetical protein
VSHPSRTMLINKQSGLETVKRIRRGNGIRTVISNQVSKDMA